MRIRLIAALCLATSLACVPSRDTPAQRSSSSQPNEPAPAATSLAVVSANGIQPNPLISRGKRVTGQSPVAFAKPSSAFDGDQQTAWAAGKPTPEQPAWIAIDVGHGPTRLLFRWSASGSYNYEETDYGSPGAYRIDTSADSTDGADGTWKSAVNEPSVTTHGASRSFDFAGQRWVKLVVTAAPANSPNGVQIDEIAVHDVSAGAGDTWFFMGDSITAFAFGRSVAPGLAFADRIHERHSRYDPVVINGGIGGEKADDGVRHVDEWIGKNPDAHFWAVAYGTNDAAGDTVDVARFRNELRTIVQRLQAVGRVPILPKIPFASDGKHPNIAKLNVAIDEIREGNSLPAGPDLYAWFSDHPDELRDGIHPNDKGIESINRLWAEAVERLYVP